MKNKIMDSLSGRNIRWLWLKFRRSLNPNKIKLPKKMSEAEKIAVSLFMKLIKDPESKLYYDISTSECFTKR